MSTKLNVQTTPNIKEEKEEKKDKADFITDLAEQLAYNYLSSSFGDDDKPDLHLHMKEICEDNVSQGNGNMSFAKMFQKGDRIRNILLIGAGSSYDVYKGIPVGKGLIQEVKERYVKEITAIDFLSEKFQSLENDIKDITGETDLNFENYLYILSEHFVTQKDLREKIKEMTGFKYAVSLFNEIVAHMLKHCFIDVVINMNFEETLDQVIKEEIGNPNYINVLSDGDCVDLEDVLVDGRLKTPFYIKPHGTFGHKSTLRFTDRHYLDLPEDIKQLLQALLSGKRSNSRRSIERINLICVGYAMQSFELNKIINKSLPEESVIYHIDFSFLEEEKFKEKFQIFTDKALRKGRKHDDYYKTFSTQSFSQNTVQKSNKAQLTSSDNQPVDINNNANNLTPSLGELFSILWRAQYNMFKKAYKPRSIVRHEIISYLFYNPWLGRVQNQDSIEERKKLRKHLSKNIEEHPKFFLDRVIVEMAIILNRNNGILDMAELLKGRVGTYYKKYEETFLRNPKTIKKRFTIYEILEEFTDIVEPQKAFQKIIAAEGNTVSLFTLQTLLQENYTDLDIIEISEKLIQNFKTVRIEDECDITLADKEPLIKSLQDRFISLFTKSRVNEKNNKAADSDHFLKLSRTCTLMVRLLSSKKLSNRFKLNFLKNHNKLVYNGKLPEEAGKNPPYNTMIEELFRLFYKSVGSHYFVINSQAKNPAHFYWKSFSQKKLIHTNLALSYEINNLFLRWEWDVILSISDTGSWLKSLNKIIVDNGNSTDLKEKFGNRKIIIIGSYQHIQQLYPYVTNNTELIKKHKEALCSDFFDHRNIILFLLPFNQHNNHTITFLKTVNPLNLPLWKDIGRSWTLLRELESIHSEHTQSQHCFIALGSVYMHRQGFSSNIDPIYIGLDSHETTNADYKEDQERVLKIFVEHILRVQENGEFSTESVEKKFLEPFCNNELKPFDSRLNVFLDALYKYVR